MKTERRTPPGSSVSGEIIDLTWSLAVLKQEPKEDIQTFQGKGKARMTDPLVIDLTLSDSE